MMTLGELIDTLEALPPEMPVRMRRKSGLGFISWRGVYAEPSLDHGGTTLAASLVTKSIGGFSYRDSYDLDRRAPAETVGELLAVARDVAAGGMLGGYKGDWFPMQRFSPLHADPYGECPGSEVIGIKVRNGAAVIQVHERTYEDES